MPIVSNSLITDRVTPQPPGVTQNDALAYVSWPDTNAQESKSDTRTITEKCSDIEEQLRGVRSDIRTIRDGMSELFRLFQGQSEHYVVHRDLHPEDYYAAQQIAGSRTSQFGPDRIFAVTPPVIPSNIFDGTR